MNKDPRDLEPAAPARREARIASSVRKAQVRAALFRRGEPVRIGRFVLLEPLGAGAMGEIFAAYDEQLDRKVALKLVRGGSDLTARADERLLREAQTLAQVSHPNVVQIYEAGTYDGRLFIAMELVRGRTLTQWLRDAGQLPRAVRQREIFRQFLAAGRGLEAAHAAGVAHRDFKPDNVLVGDDGRVRVVDFGLARALVDEEGGAAPGSGAAAAVPAPGAGRGGTEVMDVAAQKAAAAAAAGAEGGAVAGSMMLDRVNAMTLVTDGFTIDHAPDPELLAAAAGAEAGNRETARGDEATSDDVAASSAPRLKAALRLTQTGTVMGTPFFMAPEQMSGAVADRRSDQFSFCVALYHALYGEFPFSGRSLRELFDSMQSDEVEFIAGVPVPSYVRHALHRGLSVDPAQRFPTMSDLLTALTPRRRRRSWLLAAAATFAVVAIGLMVVPAVLADPCAAAGTGIAVEWALPRQLGIHAAFLRSDLPFGEVAWQGVKSRVDGYARSWHDEATAACRATHVEHTQSGEHLDKRMLCLDRGRRQLAALLAELGGGSAAAVEHAVEATGALPDLAVCSRAENLLLAVASPPAPVEAQVTYVRDRLAQARAQELLGRYEESLAVARDAHVVAVRLDYTPLRAEALTQIARSLGARGTEDARHEAQTLYFEALTLAEAERHDLLVDQIRRGLVHLAIQIDPNMEQARQLWRQASAWSRRIAFVRNGGRSLEDDAELHFALGEIYFHDGEYAKAAEEERRAIALATQPLERSRCEAALANSLDRMGEVDEALRLHEHALATTTEMLGAGHPHVITLMINFAGSLSKAGQRERARRTLAHALESMPLQHRDSVPVAQINALLSDIECGDGHLDRAAEHARASLQIYQHALSADHVRIAAAYTNLANVEQRRRNFGTALALYQRALELRRHHLGDDHYLVGTNEGNIAETLVELERHDDALAHVIEAERILARGSGRERAIQAWILMVRGEALVGLRRYGAAVVTLEQALPLFGDDGVDPTNHALAMWTLARALYAAGGDRERVRKLAEQADAIFATHGTLDAPWRESVRSFLVDLK